MTNSAALGRIIVVGGSVAGARVAQALRAEGFQGELIVVEREAGEAYDRPPLSKQYLEGAWTREQIALIPGGWASVNATAIHASAVSLDTDARELTLSTGQKLSYDALVIATGLSPRRLTADDGEPIGHVIATADDADAVRARLAPQAHVVAVGGGYISVEAASVARELDLKATIIDRRPNLLESHLGTTVAEFITESHREHGVNVLSNTVVTSIERTSGGARLMVQNTNTGEVQAVEADVLIAGIGSTPNTQWLEGSKIKCSDGVVTDARCRAFGAKGVYALGDVARFYDVHSAAPRRVGHWTNAADQATVVAHNILHPDAPNGYREYPYFWSDQFGQKIQVTGHPDADAHVDLLTLEGPVPRTVAIYSHGDENECGAVVTFGWPRGMVAARRLMPLDPTTAEMLEELEKLTGVARVAAR
ncbi:NAD(P)/FAD-dependent oxidoreductase [Arthrobacter sp. TMS1-12-1]